MNECATFVESCRQDTHTSVRGGYLSHCHFVRNVYKCYDLLIVCSLSDPHTYRLTSNTCQITYPVAMSLFAGPVSLLNTLSMFIKKKHNSIAK
jgi:hypothetical protein